MNCSESAFWAVIAITPRKSLSLIFSHLDGSILHGLMRILAVENQVKMLALLGRGLQEESYAVEVAATADN